MNTKQLGEAATYIRDRSTLTQKSAAKKLGITNVHLCNVEAGRSMPSLTLIAKYREVFGVDVYVMAWCMFGDVEKLPERIRHMAAELSEQWKAEIDDRFRFQS